MLEPSAKLRWHVAALGQAHVASSSNPGTVVPGNSYHRRVVKNCDTCRSSPLLHFVPKEKKRLGVGDRYFV